MGSVGVLIILIIAGVFFLVGIHDLFQKRHAILRNFPIVGHLRYLLEKLAKLVQCNELMDYSR